MKTWGADCLHHNWEGLRVRHQNIHVLLSMDNTKCIQPQFPVKMVALLL